MRIILLISVAAAMLLAGCASPNPGKYYAPAYLPIISDFSAPTETVANGETVTLSVEWIYGREPFVVTWFIGDDEEGEAFPVPGRSHSFQLTAVNEGVEDITAIGVVEVKDAGGNPVTRTFSFDIAPTV